MGLPQLYSKLLLKHPTKILLTIITVVVILFLITLFIKPLPTFNNPIIGFEARNTLISTRINSWKLLADDSSASANNLSLIPNSNKYDGSYYQSSSSKISNAFDSKSSFEDINNNNSNDDENYSNPDNNEPPLIEMSTSHNGSSSTSNYVNEIDEDEDEYYKSISNQNKLSNNNDESLNLVHYSLGSSKAFCGKLYEGYSQFVISPSTRYSSSGLFNINSMLAICQLDKRLRLEQSDANQLFHRECERFQLTATNNNTIVNLTQNQLDLDKTKANPVLTACCNSWSIPNYIACLNNRTSCMDIQSNDLRVTENLLNLCAPYYFKAPYEECFSTQNYQHQAKISASTSQATTQSHPVSSTLNILTSPTSFTNNWPSKSYCGSIPEKCMRCDGWIYTVMNYLVNDNFILNKFHPTANNDLHNGSHNNSGESNSIRFKNPYGSNRRANSITYARENSIVNRLSYTNIFLPMAKGSSLMKYYQSISKSNLKTPYAQVKAMDLGLKNSLFEHLISDDTKLFIVALVSVLFVISIYTCSLILSCVTLLIICLSLCLSYTIYELLFNIPIFPFMNLLAVVISFGICSDNAMMFCKHFSTKMYQQSNEENHDQEDDGDDDSDKNEINQQQANEIVVNGNTLVNGQEKRVNSTTDNYTSEKVNEEQINLDRMLKKAVLSTLVATIATACSFVISAISNVIAVRCFCIFATLSVITNYVLIILLLPPALILDSRFNEVLKKFLSSKGNRIQQVCKFAEKIRLNLLNFELTLHGQWIFKLVTQYKFYYIITFLALLLCSCIIVFHSPTLQPSDEEELQLLSTRHSFEQYDKRLRKQFAFERFKMGEPVVPYMANNQQQQQQFHFDVPETLPVRIVFGVIPEDNGNHLDPMDRGTLKFDPKFDLADPNVQIWLYEFCQKLKNQRFIHPSSAPNLSNCFIDTFKSWMDNRSCRDQIQNDLDRSPCCQSYAFPYSRYTFNKCIGEAIKIIRKTPQFNTNNNAGLRFFKNSTKVAALIIEYQSNRLYSESFKKMDRFFNDIDEWVTWQINNTAPSGLKSGWFISNNMELLALQTELEISTVNSILIEISFAMLAIFLGTRNMILTLAGSLTIGTIIIVTVAILILMKWTLGVAESILISLTIGLSIDFALHYSVAYSEKRGGLRSNDAILHRILSDVGSPIALATITTSLAGFIILWSDILAYQELGVFLLIIASVSWLASTFFLLSMLATIDSILEQGILYGRFLVWNVLKVFLNRR